MTLRQAARSALEWAGVVLLVPAILLLLAMLAVLLASVLALCSVLDRILPR